MGDDVIYDILSRLPIKSLARFRCVCKSWLKYINNPHLETIHRVKEEPTPVIFQLLPSNHPDSNNKQLHRISFMRVTQGTTTVKQHHLWDVPYIDWSYQSTPVLGSCNGLTLVCYENSFHGTFLAVINPLTKQRYNLPLINISSTHPGSLQAAGIAFNDSTNSLTTVCILRKEPFPPRSNPQLCTMVHHSGMSSWREIPQNPDLPVRGESVFANGRLHWLSRCIGFQTANDERKLVWFDVKMGRFGLTDAPEGGRYRQLVDLKGEVGFAYNYGGIRMRLWVLKLEEWVLWCWFDLSQLRYMDVMVSGCWNNDGDILLTTHGGKRLFVYTLKTHAFKEVEYWEDGLSEYAYIRMHQSSFFSICGIEQMLIS